jgi:hypothetical protein
LISVGSEVQILPGPPPVFMGAVFRNWLSEVATFTFCEWRRRTIGLWGRSSVGRAPAVCRRHWFDSGRLHQRAVRPGALPLDPAKGHWPLETNNWGQGADWPLAGSGGARPSFRGGVAQLGEHLLCKQGVVGSNPIVSTMYRREENSSARDMFVSPLRLSGPRVGQMTIFVRVNQVLVRLWARLVAVCLTGGSS